MFVYFHNTNYYFKNEYQLRRRVGFIFAHMHYFCKWLNRPSNLHIYVKQTYKKFEFEAFSLDGNVGQTLIAKDKPICHEYINPNSIQSV